VNDLDDLRDAMHSTPDFAPRPLDLAAVMIAGGRLRRRRRLAVGAASGLAVLVLLIGGAQFARSRPAEPTGDAVAARPPGTAVAAVPADDTFGEVVDTGVRTGDQTWLLWIKRIDDPALPDTSIGMVAGRRDAGGRPVVDMLSNETEGSDRSPGFHAMQMASKLGSGTTPAYGYYVGDAARITVVADGRTVTARRARWSEDSSIVLFWFTLKQVNPGTTVKQVTAYDSTGRRLPAGNASFGVG
jgi:hypothetical protein